MQIILIILALYFIIGAVFGLIALGMLWSIGHFSLPKEKQQNKFCVFFRMMFQWGTIPFRAKSSIG